MSFDLAGLSPASARPGVRRFVLLAAGVASILAMAPFFLSPILFFTFPLLIAALDASRHAANPTRRAFEAGWWFGFGYHLAGLFWIGEAFLVEAETFGILMPFAVTLMPAGLALFWGAATAVAHRFWTTGLARLLILAVSLAAAEWLRGHVLTGFPWNIIGYALTFPLPLMQTASVLGIYGLTLVAIVVFALPGTRWLDGWRPRNLAGRTAFVAIAIAPMLALAIAGSLLLVLRPPAADLPIQVRIVQPSVPQREKWIPDNQERIFRQHLELSRHTPGGAEDGGAGKSLIIWPEAAMPFLPLQSPVALSMIGEMLPTGASLISGALRAEPKGPTGSGQRSVFNSLLVIGAGGSPVAHYDKIHLVPFGEYLPLQSTLESIGLQQLSKMRGGFASGVRPRPLLDLPGLPAIGPLICYEAIFPSAVVQGPRRPALLVNVTNDGWFGNTTGPRQHLHQTRVRAVEEGLPILRAANNGISAVIDAQGRVRAAIGMNVIGVIDSAVPGQAARPLYSFVGDWPFVGLIIVALLWWRRSTRGAR